jgi:hypothetical protein
MSTLTSRLKAFSIASPTHMCLKIRGGKLNLKKLYGTLCIMMTPQRGTYNQKNHKIFIMKEVVLNESTLGTFVLKENSLF